METGNGLGREVAKASLLEDVERRALASESTCFNFKIEKVLLLFIAMQTHCRKEMAFVVKITNKRQDAYRGSYGLVPDLSRGSCCKIIWA